MALTKAEVVPISKTLFALRGREKPRLDRIFAYLRDDPDSRTLGGLPRGAPQDVIRLARMSRVNLVKYVVNARVQGLYVQGFQTPKSPDNLEAWNAWQRNGFDARQIGVHRAALSYGASYVTVMPSDRGVPVMRGASPRELTVAYGDDDEWPLFALERRPSGEYRLIDDTNVWHLRAPTAEKVELVAEDPLEHGMRFDGRPVCPVVRFRDTDDLDDPCRGIVEPLFPLQDQINITTFGLQVAQHYGAFRQRYVIGWLAESESEALRASAARLMQFEDPPSDVQVGEFAQTDLRGYIESREATVRHMATVSQTAVHELMGQFVNLSAEALEAARASHHAALEENRTVMGESWEQLLNLSAENMGAEVDPEADVVWRDTRVRSLTEAATALGLIAEKLGVPEEELWSRLPGVPQHELRRWRRALEDRDSIDGFDDMVGEDGGSTGAPTNAPASA